MAVQSPYPGTLLRAGSRGNNVALMQRYLNEIGKTHTGIPWLSPDGIFGPATQRAVTAFQNRFGLSADGIIGPLTWAKIVEVYNEVSGGGNSENAPSGLSADEAEVFNLVNAQRTRDGLPALKINPEVQKVARIKAQDMVAGNYFGHNSPTYGAPSQMLTRFGIPYRYSGENIAGNPSNAAAVTAWMNSPGHRANILNRNYGETGIGVVKDPRYGKMFVQMFID